MRSVNPRRLALEAIAAALRPPPQIDLLKFAEEHVILDGPFAGPFNRAVFPFFDDILRALSPADPCRFVTLMTSAQCGKTTIGNVFTLANMTLGRGSVLVAHPTTDAAIRWSKIKLAPMMRATSIVADAFPQRQNDTLSSLLYKERHDGLARLLITGANSPASLSQVTIDAQVQDDLAKWETSSAGDPEQMCDSRSRAIASAKIFKASTPLIEPGCRITKSFNEGSQEMPFIPCPHCGAMQILEWSNMLANLDPEQPEAAHFTCAECGGVIEERHRPQMLRGFAWRAQNPAAMFYHRSFWIWSAYSPLQSWEQIAREWLKNRGDPAGEQTFFNDVLGKPYETRSSGRPWEELRDRAAKSHYPRGTVPAGALVLCMGIDHQLDRLEWLLCGFGRDYRRYVVDYGSIFGTIDEPDTQDNLDALLARTWPNQAGRPIALTMAAIDANYLTDSVLSFARKYPPSRLIAVRGAAGDAAPRIARVQRERDEKKGTLRKHGGRFFNVGVNTFKMSLFRDLAKDDPAAPGYISFPSGCEDRLFKELCSEERVAHKRFGATIWRWEKISDRQCNECLDTLIYATAAAIKAGVNATSPQGWDRLEGQLAGPPAPAAPASLRPDGPPEACGEPPPPKQPFLARRAGWLTPRRQENDQDWAVRRLHDGGYE